MKYRVTAITLIAILLGGCALLSGLPQTPQIESLQAKAAAGGAPSQYQLGMQYTVNAQWDGDYRSGYEWFLSAAQQGHVDAQYMAGMGKLLGRGTDRDPQGALKYFLSVAEKGHARAQYQAGNAYLNGTGVEKEPTWGRQWLEQAAWNDHKYAQFLLAALFSGGIGGKENMAEAWRWSRKASENGLERADKALENLAKTISAAELALGKALLNQESSKEGDLSRVPLVRYVQTALNQGGYDAGAEDGVEGARTRTAVAEYLNQNKLPQDTRLLKLIESLRAEL